MTPRLLDLFSGAGGSAVGYHRAGFEVVGVDNAPMPHYPFEFHQADALEYLAEHGHSFDVIHASPPCQDHSPLSALVGMHGTGWLLPATQEALRGLGKPYVIENVAGAHMPATVTLCGSMFGLRTCRHRKFEVGNVFTLWSLPPHPKHRVRTSTKKRRTCWDAGLNISVTGDIGSTIGGLALDIDWMNGNELSQAIPPAYCQFIGEQLLDALRPSASHQPGDSSPGHILGTSAFPGHRRGSHLSTGDPEDSASYAHSHQSESAVTAGSSPQSGRGRDALD